MDRILRIPATIRHAHLPGVGTNDQFYRDLFHVLEEISRRLLIIESLLAILANKAGVSWADLEDAIRETASQAGERENGVKMLLAESEEMGKALVTSRK